MEKIQDRLPDEPIRERKPLFEERIEAGYVYNSRIYDVSADGGFIMAKGETRAEQDHVDVVLGWGDELSRLVATP